MAKSEPASELRAIAEWQRTMLERVLLLCLVLLSFALVMSFRQPFIFERKLFAVAILPSWLLVGWAALWPRAPERLRQMALILGMLTLSIASVAKLGFQAVNGFCVHLMLVVMVSLFLGRRASWLVWAAGILSYAWIGIATSHTIRLPPGGGLFDPGIRANWQRVVGIYALLSATTLLAVSYLVERMQGALRRSEALYAALTAESTRRIAALEEQRALEEQLRQSQKLEALGTLAGGVAHDFNNLLVVIINHAELAAQETTSPRALESLEHIQTAGDRAASLTRQLLAFGRRQVAQRTALDVNQRVDAALRMLRRLLPSNIELEHEPADDAPRVWAADVELDQIIMNLCVNARDAMPNGGKLVLRACHAQRRRPGNATASTFVRLTIQDSGVGMDDATRQRIFEPFFTTKSPGHGTGLGLSTVHGLVQQSNGFIEVDSAPGRGTSVHIYLPSYEGQSNERSSVVPFRVKRGHETILVVDDDANVRSVLARRLEANGYRVIACQDGVEALEAFRSRPHEIALVVSDAVMPKLGGRDLHRAISREFGEVPFLICSGYAAQTLEAEFFDHPLRGFLSKPFNEETLQLRVRELLDAAAAREKVTDPSFPATAKPIAQH